MSIEAEIDTQPGYTMSPMGESLLGFAERHQLELSAPDTFVIYSAALGAHRQKLANEAGVTLEQLHTGQVAAVPIQEQ